MAKLHAGQIVLIAGGGYLVYRALQSSGLLRSAPSLGARVPAPGMSATGPYASGYRFPTSSGSPVGDIAATIARAVGALLPRPDARSGGSQGGGGFGGGTTPGAGPAGRGSTPAGPSGGNDSTWTDSMWQGPIDQAPIEGTYDPLLDWSTFGSAWGYDDGGNIVYYEPSPIPTLIPDWGPSGDVAAAFLPGDEILPPQFGVGGGSWDDYGSGWGYDDDGNVVSYE